MTFNLLTFAVSGMSKMSYGVESPSRTHQRSRLSCGDMVGNSEGTPYRKRGGGLNFEVEKGLLDWDSLIAIGDQGERSVSESVGS